MSSSKHSVICPATAKGRHARVARALDGPSVHFDELAFAEDISHATAADRRVAIDTRASIAMGALVSRPASSDRDAISLQRADQSADVGGEVRLGVIQDPLLQWLYRKP
jgi:hypothetical protein